MKRITLIAAALAALASCGQKNVPFLSGTLTGIEDGMLMAFYSGDGDTGVMAMDTIYVDNGKFTYNLEVTEPGTVMIVEPKHFVDNLTLYAVPGEHAVIKGTLTDYEMTGSTFYKDWYTFHKMAADNEAARRALISSIPEDDDPDYDMAEFSAKDRAIKQEWDKLAVDYIQKYPESDLCAYLAHELSKIDDFDLADDTISDKVKKGPLGFLLVNKALAFDAEALRQESMKNIFEGAVAPDFSLKTSTGETFTLSEHRGGYVLLDFWGTWCGWCVEGLPTLKEIAHAYKDKLTVVSVDTKDPEGAWREGIEKYGMDWIQVYNSREDAIDSIYAVQGFPGFYLINPEGVIVMMSFGEPAHFVEKIGELISK